MEQAGRRLAEGYRFLRRLENRLQMMGDAQVYALPSDPAVRQRLAAGLGFDGFASMLAALDTVRDFVSAEFAALLAQRQKQHKPDSIAAYWKQLPEGGDGEALADAGFGEAAAQALCVRQDLLIPALAALGAVLAARHLDAAVADVAQQTVPGHAIAGPAVGVDPLAA